VEPADSGSIASLVSFVAHCRPTIFKEESMRQRTFHANALIFVLLLAGALVHYFAVGGCGSGGYDAPSTTSSPALISAESLKTWVDEGKVNGEGFDRVVILDVTDKASYDNASIGHIPGAQLLNTGTELYQIRLEGLAPDVNMVPEGSLMDAVIQKSGIDRNTTIVFTTSTSILNATRAYFTFRYWGFPKERLKVLDGMNNGWFALFPETRTAVAPVVTPSTYSVRNNGALRADLRASLGEMMAVAADTDPDTVIVDGRSGASAGCYAGIPKSTAGVFAPGSDYVVFEGHMKGAKALAYSNLYSSNRFKAVDNVVAQFAAIGVDGSKTTYVHCRTGVIASLEFFVLDGILGWKTVLYDGSWSQWGQMSGEKGGGLASGSAWRTDVSALSELVVYNQDNAALVETLPLDGLAAVMYTSPGDPRANQIEKEDADYMSGGGIGSTPPGGGGGGGGC
jgi:3-mercaptopyruvate sulfurtransferase SseA